MCHKAMSLVTNSITASVAKVSSTVVLISFHVVRKTSHLKIFNYYW